MTARTRGVLKDLLARLHEPNEEDEQMITRIRIICHDISLIYSFIGIKVN